jgi:hypothetical protein
MSEEAIIYDAAVRYLRRHGATNSNGEWLCDLIWGAVGLLEDQEGKRDWDLLNTL